MTAWSRVLPPVEGGGPGCSAFRETAEHQRSARPWPPSAPLGRCGPKARRPCLCLGLRSRPGPWASGPLPWLGPLRCAPGSLRPIGGPPAPVGAGRLLPRRPPLRRGRGLPPAGSPRRRLRPPALGSCGPPFAPLRARCGGARPWLLRSCLRPILAAPVPPLAAPCRAARLTPWAAAPPPSGGRLGRAAPA